MADQLHFATTGVRAPDPMDAVRMATPLDWEAAVERGVDLYQRSEKNRMVNAQLQAELEATPMRLQQEETARTLAIQESSLRIGELETMAPIRKEKALAELSRLQQEVSFMDDEHTITMRKHALELKKAGLEAAKLEVLNSEESIKAENDAKLREINARKIQIEQAGLEANDAKGLNESGLMTQVAINGSSMTPEQIMETTEKIFTNFPNLPQDLRNQILSVKDKALDLPFSGPVKDRNGEDIRITKREYLEARQWMKAHGTDDISDWVDANSRARISANRQAAIEQYRSMGVSPEIADQMANIPGKLLTAKYRLQEDFDSMEAEFYGRNPQAKEDLLNYSPTSTTDAMVYATLLQKKSLAAGMESGALTRELDDMPQGVPVIGGRPITSLGGGFFQSSPSWWDIEDEVDLRKEKFEEALKSTGNVQEATYFQEKIAALDKLKKAMVTYNRGLFYEPAGKEAEYRLAAETQLEAVAGEGFLNAFKGWIGATTKDKAERLAAGNQLFSLLEKTAPTVDIRTGTEALTKADRIGVVINSTGRKMNRFETRAAEVRSAFFLDDNSDSQGVLPRP